MAVYMYAMVTMLYNIKLLLHAPTQRTVYDCILICDGNHLLKTGNGEKKKTQMANLCHKRWRQHGYNLTVYVYSSVCLLGTMGLTGVSWCK